MSSSDAASALLARVRDRGFTPGLKHVPALLDLLGSVDEDDAPEVERAIARVEAANVARAANAVVTRAREAERPLRARLTRVAGRLAQAGADDARAWLVEAVADADPKTRRAAARALGKLPRDEAIARALLDAWDRASSDDDRRALAEPLGKLGSAEAKERLAALHDAAGETGRRARRAEVLADREAARRGGRATHARPAIVRDRAMDAPVVVRFHTRAGLEAILEEELGERWRPRVAGPGVVEARLDGPIADALDVRTALDVGFPLEPLNVAGGLAETIVRALTGERAMRVFRTYTETGGAPVRFRLAFATPGHRRALVWRCAELVRDATPELANDPRESAWEVLVDDAADRVALELLPRGFVDARFAYRTRVVPASSSPALAAALARLAPRRDDDVVWDPFVGSGAELVERARLGPYARLVGTDVDAAAVDAARANLAAADVARAALEVADATRFDPGRVTLVLTNPPMGRRVARGGHRDLLSRFVEHAAEVLVPGGALVWPVPEPRAIAERAARAGLVLERAFTVDMGGFPAEASVFKKRV